MKKIIIHPGILLFLLFHFGVGYSQEFALQAESGLGRTLAAQQNGNQKSRFLLGLTGYYSLKKQVLVGIEVAASASFVEKTGGKINESYYNPLTKTYMNDPTRMNGTAVLAKLKYIFSGEKVKPFGELGIGMNSYGRKIFTISPETDGIPVKQRNFAIQPEAGVQAGHFQLSVCYLKGGKTPSFTGVNSNGSKVILESTRISALYIKASWLFDF